MAVKLTFLILSVLDFMESSKDWSMDVFESNVVTLKNELKDIECEDTSNPYYPCRMEIEDFFASFSISINTEVLIRQILPKRITIVSRKL